MPEKKLKKYKVSCYETVHSYFYVDAESKKDALEKAEKVLWADGMPEDANIFDREYEACSAELIEE